MTYKEIFIYIYLVIFISGRRVTIFSEPTNDIVKGYTKSKLLAVFDSYGNGVVYNDCGDIRYSIVLSKFFHKSEIFKSHCVLVFKPDI